MKILKCLSIILASLVSCMAQAQTKTNSLSPKTDLKGVIGKEETLGVERMFKAPFTSLQWLRADLTNETVTKDDNTWFTLWHRPFKNYSGDISGRYLQLMAMLSGGNKNYHPQLAAFLQELPKLQQQDGHFGWANINWNDTIDFRATEPKMMPALWGNGRMLCALVQAYQTFKSPELLNSAKKLGDFYITIGKRFNDKSRKAEFISGDTYAAAFVTCYFNAMEGLAQLYAVTKEAKYLKIAEDMAAFYNEFDVLPVEHAHGMLCNQYAMALLYEETGKKAYLEKIEKRWDDLVEGGYVNPAGGLPEGATFKSMQDEGCAEADWLRFNLKLNEITGNNKYLDMAERLLWNHYLANQKSSGGYGTRFLLGDQHGIYGFAKYNLEATWCCDFHCVLGFQVLKPLLAVSSGDEIRINFPLSFDATLNVAGNQWNIQSGLTEGKGDGVIYQQTVALKGSKDRQTKISFRLPEWATGFTATTADGTSIAFEPKGGFWVSKEPLRSGSSIVISYKGGLVFENRNCQPLKIPANVYTGKVVLRYGPQLLSLDGVKNMPVLLLNTDSIQVENNLLKAKAVVDGSRAEAVELKPREPRLDTTESVFVFDAVIKNKGN